jgi:hypothetical protein
MTSPSERVRTHRPRHSGVGVLAAFLALPFLTACDDDGAAPVTPTTPAPAELEIVASAAPAGTQDPVTPNTIEIRTFGSDGQVLHTYLGAFSEDPSRSFGPYQIQVGETPVSAARLEVAIFRGMDAERVHVWSASTEGVTLTPGARTTVNLEFFRGSAADLTLSSLALAGAPTEIGIGEEFQLSAVGSPASADFSPAWGSLTPSLLSMSRSGTIRGLAEGTARVVVSAGPHVVEHEIQVRRIATSVEVDPSAHTFTSLQETMTLSATVRDFRGEVRPEIGVTWTSSNPSVAVVDATGLVRSMAPGSAVITASVEGLSGSATLTVAQEPAGVVLVDPLLELGLGESAGYTAWVVDANGWLIAGRTVAWSSSNPSVIAIEADGTAWAMAEGSATLTASWNGLSAAVEVTVPPVPPTVGHFRLGWGTGTADQASPIVTAGGDPVSLTSLSAAEIAGVSLLFVDNPWGPLSSTEQAAVVAWVQAGGVLIYHDRDVTTAAARMPGGAGIAFTEAYGTEIDVLDGSTLVTDGPGGVVTHTTLDGGNYSTHGYVPVASLPAGARTILTTGNPAHAVTFSYPVGAGHVIYSSIPLDHYLQGPDPAAFREIYAPNVVAYGIFLRTGVVPDFVALPARVDAGAALMEFGAGSRSSADRGPESEP